VTQAERLVHGEEAVVFAHAGHAAVEQRDGLKD